MAETKKVKELKVVEILDAFLASLHPTKLEKERAEARLEICKACENYSDSVPRVCKNCGCFISKKIYSRADSPCPENRWSEPDKNYLDEVDKIKKTSLV